jgi:PEP-CTERM motif-containing protein
MKLAPTLLALVGTLALATASLQAQIYTEIGDAGQTLAGAQTTGILGGQPLNTIVGTISTGTDADLFLITLTAPTTFSATTTGGLTLMDTALFLFDGMGNAIFTNDDANGMSLQSTLPAGTGFTMTLGPGTYYLGISLSGNEPINQNGQLLFEAYINGDSTSLRGPASGINPSTEFDFNGNTSFSETGVYEIDLTGVETVAVPEPSTIGLFIAGALAVGAAVRRRRNAAALVA